MKELQINGLCKCGGCGSAAALLTNAKNQFQVRCPNCGERTKWTRKTDAVIEWFNLFLNAKKKPKLRAKA